MDRMGVGGAGLAFLLAQALTALIVAVPLLRFARTLRREARAAEDREEPARDLADSTGSTRT